MEVDVDLVCEGERSSRVVKIENETEFKVYSCLNLFLLFIFLFLGKDILIII